MTRHESQQYQLAFRQCQNYSFEHKLLAPRYDKTLIYIPAELVEMFCRKMGRWEEVGVD